MARKKKTTRKKTKGTSTPFPWRGLFILLLVCVILAGVGVGFYYLEIYVKRTSPVAQQIGSLQLLDVPQWVSKELLQKIAGSAGGRDFHLDEQSAKVVASNLQLLPWLYHVQVRTTSEAIRVSAEYRKPVARIERAGAQFYLAWAYPERLPEHKDIIILDYVAIYKLPIVEIAGYTSMERPTVGAVLEKEDIQVGVELLTILEKMDRGLTPEKPLLAELAKVDVSNLGGRKNKESHIVLHATDGTQILWGAAVGEFHRYMEATDKEKLEMLYGFYKQHGTLLGKVKYIDLRMPQREIPRPSAN